MVLGITEMLMQSQDGEINLLPALPKEWANGSVSGIVARKGFEVDMEWKVGKLQSLVVKSNLGNTLNLRYNNMVKRMETKRGDVIKFNHKLDKI